MISPKRVLHVIDTLDLGGAQTFLLGLVKCHNRLRYLPEVACMHGRGVYTSDFEKNGITVHSLSPCKFPPYYLPNFWRLMSSGGYDILHFHLFGANLCAKPLAIMAGHPAIIVHDQCNDATREKNPLLLAFDAFWNRCSNHVIAVSESTRRYLLDREDLPDEMVAMIPNGIDAKDFKPATECQKRDSRNALGLPEDVVLIGGFGRLVPQKNFSLFLDVAAQIIRRYPNLIFVIAGTGPQEKALKAKASDRGLCNSVRFLGHVSDRVGFCRALDVLLITSDFEGTPMTLLEAMASGLPVVASAVDGIAEVCTNGKDALLVPPHNLENFVSALERVLGEERLAWKLGENARRTILGRYEILGLVRRIEALYEMVLEER